MSNTMLELLQAVLAAVTAAVAPFIILWLRAKKDAALESALVARLDRDGRMRAVLNEAFETAAELIMLNKLSGVTATSFGVNYVKNSVPDAIIGLGSGGQPIPTSVLTNKMEKVLGVTARNHSHG